MKTLSISTDQATREWLLVDATDIPVGRLASRIAGILRGKNKPSFTPHADTGDYVIVINADKVALTGKKWENKIYHHHTGYMGGLKSISAKNLHEKDGTAIVSKAIKGMIPRGPLGRQIIKKLKVYSGAEHPHVAQNPRTVQLTK